MMLVKARVTKKQALSSLGDCRGLLERLSPLAVSWWHMKFNIRRQVGFKQKLLVNKKQHLPLKNCKPMKGILLMHRYFR